MDANLMDANLAGALEQLAATTTLLVALDFDGTMAPIVPRADDARPLPGTATAFSELTALPDTHTALISGRALHSLRAVARPPVAAWLVGSHGAEQWLGAGSAALSLSPEQQRTVHQVNHALEEVSARHPGSSVEFKPAGAVLHTRQMPSAEAATAAIADGRAAITELADAGRTVYPHLGKQVLEVAILQVDKGQAIDLLRDQARATGVLFVGDDTTDENGFAVLRDADVGVKVGAGDTGAAYRISGVEGTEGVLRALLAGRRRYLGQN